MTLYSVKPAFQALLRPVAGRLAGLQVTANAVTVLALTGSLIVGGVIALKTQQHSVFLLWPLWLPVRMALNALDGMLAREFNQKSTLGAYLNELGDVLSDAALYAPLALLSPFIVWQVACFVMLAALSEFAGVLGVMVGASRRYDGPMGKSDRALVIGALGLWIGMGGALPEILSWLVPLLCLLLAITIFRRVSGGIREADVHRHSTS